MSTFMFEFVAPDGPVYSGPATSVIAPGTEGDFEVLAGHEPTMSALRPGVVSFAAGGETRRHFVRGGFVEVGALGATLLAEATTPLAKLDAGKLESEIAGARQDVEDAADAGAKRAAQERLDRLNELKGALKL